MPTGFATNGVCSPESVNGNRDACSCKDSDSLSADHLVIMVHGILGSSSDWKFGAEQFVKRLPDKVFVHCSEHNMSERTLDGVDIMGERLAKEVSTNFIMSLRLFKKSQIYAKISFVAHSVGGLVARYAIGRLYRPPKEEVKEDTSGNGCKEEAEGTIGGLEAMNFITVATPHLGSRGNKQVPFLFGVTAFEKAAKHCKAYDNDQDEAEDNGSHDKLEEELVRGLSRVSWEKIDVSFHRSKQRIAAHSVIQVKDQVLHIEGADVIRHMIDKFLT
ncbi:hypothetical protein GQ457_15G007360 [Hibiscus cannabinus]